jgi:hypothetical protein
MIAALSAGPDSVSPDIDMFKASGTNPDRVDPLKLAELLATSSLDLSQTGSRLNGS